MADAEEAYSAGSIPVTTITPLWAAWDSQMNFRAPGKYSSSDGGMRIKLLTAAFEGSQRRSRWRFSVRVRGLPPARPSTASRHRDELGSLVTCPVSRSGIKLARYGK